MTTPARSVFMDSGLRAREGITISIGVLPPLFPSSPPREWGRGQGEGAAAEKNESFDISPAIEAPSPRLSPASRGRGKKTNERRRLHERVLISSQARRPGSKNTHHQEWTRSVFMDAGRSLSSRGPTARRGGRHDEVVNAQKPQGTAACVTAFSSGALDLSIASARVSAPDGSAAMVGSSTQAATSCRTTPPSRSRSSM
jgi:hypothetical protein